jgi:hypothetical protein
VLQSTWLSIIPFDIQPQLPIGNTQDQIRYHLGLPRAKFRTFGKGKQEVEEKYKFIDPNLNIRAAAASNQSLLKLHSNKPVVMINPPFII